ncbi:MAG: hypothetical protein WD595_03555 [Waddliaceae bacterium]
MFNPVKQNYNIADSELNRHFPVEGTVPLYNTVLSEALASASKTAEDILNQLQKPQGNSNPPPPKKIGNRVVIREYHHFWGGSPFPFFMGPSRVVHHHHYNESKKKDDNSAAIRIIVGLAATVIGGYAIYKLGEGGRRIIDTGEEIQEIAGRKAELSNRMNCYGNDNVDLNRAPAFRAQVLNILGAHSRIFKRTRQNALIDIAITVGVVAGAVLAIAWAVTPIGAIGITALALFMISGGATLFKLGFSDSEKRNRVDAERIQSEIKRLLPPASRSGLPFAWIK